MNHKKYKRIFQILQNYRKEGQLLEEGMNEKYRSVHRSPDLYEIWCFFKILEILMLQKGYMADRVAWHGKMNAPLFLKNGRRRILLNYFLKFKCI